jgi:Flp pilus assembly protein TadG
VPRDDRRDSTHGQVLPIFAVGLIVFIGIAALVIDLGFIWMAHRHQQDAVDPGAIAAARYIQPSADTTKMDEAACFYARENGYFEAATDNGYRTPTGCTSANDSQGATLTVNYPPSTSAGQYAGHTGYVQVILSQPQRVFFAGVFGFNLFNVTSQAVAAYDVGNSNSASLMALNASNCPQGGGTITGGANVSIFEATGVTGAGGFVQVNSNCTNGTPDSICATGSGQGGLNVNGTSSLSAPEVYVVGTCTGGGTVTSPDGGDPLSEGAAYVGDPLAGLGPPPTASTATACAKNNKLTTPSGAEGCNFTGSTTVSLSPGVYYGGWHISGSNVQITLQPGVYWIAGGGITQSGGTLTSAGGEVLIYSTDDPYYAAQCLAGTAPKQNSDCQGAVDLQASGSLSLAGLSRAAQCPGTLCPWAGLLIWQDGHGSSPDSPVKVSGSISLQISGTIYAPGANVALAGNTVTTGCTPSGGDTDCAAVQIISDTWTIAGGANLQMPYDPNLLYQLPLKGLVK